MKIKTLLFFFFISSISFSDFGQKNFTGIFIYKVSILDTTIQQLIDDREMFVYTNDTLSRMEIVNDALGPQVNIKNMSLKKSYLLMDFMGKKLAIQNDQKNDSNTYVPYKIKYKIFGRKKMNGQVLKMAIISREDLNEPRTVWYFKYIRPDILDIYDGIKGLPADYYIGTVDGIIHYSIISIEEKPVNKNLFGIPSDFEKITMNQFLTKVSQINN
jgi:hypothetical protein